MFGESGKLSCNLVISIFMIAMGAVIAGIILRIFLFRLRAFGRLIFWVRVSNTQ
jgi:hypothetical protein